MTTVKNTPNVQQRRSYTNVVQSDNFPKKEQAIVIEAKEGIQIKDYVQALGKLTSPSNIRFISRISNGRICVFLASKDIADTITGKYNHIRINNTDLPLRPLINKYQRIIISNVYPTIPHAIIEESFDKLEIKRESAVSFLRAGITEEGYAHILSFRRQIYIHPEDVHKVPESIKIEHEQTTYWVYPSTESVKCFICKQEGHVAKNCKNNEDHPISNDTSKETPFTNAKETIETASHTSNANVPHELTNKTQNGATENTETVQNMEIDQTPMSLKRTREEITDTSSSISNETMKEPVRKPLKKKIILIDSTTKNLDTMLDPIKHMLNEPGKLLNYNQLKNFLEKTQGPTDTKETATEFVEDTNTLASFMYELYPHLKDRSIKNRFTRITRKLLKPPQFNVSTDSPIPSSEDETTYQPQTVPSTSNPPS